MSATETGFRVEKRDGRARTGTLRTRRGEVRTPVFMPVATQASVKALSQEDLESLGAEIILANAYHLYLRPGCETVRTAGGLGKFMTYRGSILTDSGGFQVMSLSELRTLNDEGVTFTSHLDGSRHTLTPERVIEIQDHLSSDIWTALDECPAYPCTEAEAARALARTRAWAERAAAEYRRRTAEREDRSFFFPILQGGVYPSLRREAAEHAATLDPQGFCLGGMSVGESKEQMWATLEATVEHMPEQKPRYLMGVGTPEDLWEAVARGVDMLDCVFPSRVGRNGTALTRGGRVNIMTARHRNDPGPLDADCACFVCRRYSRAYLSHLMRSQELAGYRYLTYHNLHFMLDIMREIRAAIEQGSFAAARASFLDRLKAAS